MGYLHNAKSLKKEKDEIVEMFKQSGQNEAKLRDLSANVMYDNREELARSAYYNYKDSSIDEHRYSFILATLFPFLNVPLYSRFVDEKTQVENAKDLFDKFDVYKMHSEHELGVIVETPILYCDDMGSFCARMKIQSDDSARTLNEERSGEVYPFLGENFVLE